MATKAPYPDTVRAAVRDAIRKSDTTVKALADASGIPRVTLMRHLNGGGRGFSVSELACIARALDIDVITLTAPTTTQAAS